MLNANWRQTMIEEVEGLEENKKWTLTPLLQKKRTIGYKWVHKIKNNPNDKIEHYKAHLVAKGYN